MSQRERPSDWRSNVAVEDASDIKQKTRLIELLEAMHGVVEKHDEAFDYYVNGEINKHARNVMVLVAVKKAIMESYNLLIQHYKQTGNRGYWLGREENPIGWIEKEHSEAVVFWGLRDVLQADEMYRETWVETSKPRNMPARKVQQEAEYTVPKWVSLNAFYRLKEFLNEEHGLDLQFEELGKGKDAGFKWTDILENGPPDVAANGGGD